MRSETAIAVQLGARRQYAVPAALAGQGRLEALYTDVCAGRGLGRAAPLIDLITPLAQRLNLKRRTPPATVLERTHVFPGWFIGIQSALRSGTDPVDRLIRLRTAHDKASQQMIRKGFGTATHVVTMFGEAIDFAAEAKSRGLVTVTDMNIAPSTEALIRDEQARRPDWEEPKIFYGQSAAAEARVAPIMDGVLGSTDNFLCPSEFVRNDLINNFGVQPERALLVPYAVNPKWLAIAPRPVPGRVLFAGGAELRKGIHILAEAARLLSQSDLLCDIQVAGHVPEQLRLRAECAHLTFLGRLNAHQMVEAFTTADVFTLPSLAEGSAGVTYEALGSSVPVVTTFEAGSVVRDGQEGRIVPARNPEALAQAILDIVSDREDRTRMAESARERAQAFSWEAFSPRLTHAVFDARERCE